jgi:hypothetical protein
MLRRPMVRLLAMVFALACMGASCGQSALAIMPGTINDPSNKALRREIFAFALDELCTEMQKRSLPLKLRDDDPSVGRFFPNGCSVQEMPDTSLFVQFTGHGYAWTNVTGRMGFEASGAVEFDHDFRLDGSTMWVYFRQRRTQSTGFKVLMVERGEGSGAAVAGLLGTTVQQAAERVGERVLSHQLARGFTVVRESDGTVQFTLGVLGVGDRPAVPFDRGDSSWKVLANERTELHGGQRDFTGPYDVEDDDALYLTALVEGAAAVDVLVLPKAVGDAWIQSHERQPGETPAPGQPLFDDFVPAATAIPGQPPALWRRPLRMPAGSYYVVLDHSATAGRTAPATRPLDDRAALVSYAVQLGDAP